MAINTDDYDIYNPGQSEGSVPEALPGTPEIDENGHLIIPNEPFFSPSTLENSLMDKDPRNTGPTTDFWSSFPLTIDINGNIFYYDENTGINVRGPAGAPRYVRYDDLTEEEKQALKGEDGTDGRDGIDGRNGVDGQDGLDAYHAWLRDNGYTEQDHPISEFYTYLAGFAESLFKKGNGTGSIIGNYGGDANTADGEGSFAIGYNTAANGQNSFVAGLNTVANANYGAAVGKNNTGETTSAFEVGIGTVSNKANGLTVTWAGNVIAANEVIDGANNRLSNKVDKVEGKGLSTNDFNNQYKSFIDNYQIDDNLNNYSSNPVQNKIIYAALQDLEQSVSAKPDTEPGEANKNFPLLSYRSTDSNARLDIGVYFNHLLYNPSKNNFLIGDNNSATGENSLVFGQGLRATANNQIILGKYNTANNTDIFQIGVGTSASSTKTLFSIDQNGNVTTDGDITDGNGNVLSGKQNTLQYDSIPTLNSTKVMTSGAIYNTLIGCGITPGQGINIPQIADLQTEITNLTSVVTALRTQVQNLIRDLYYLTDDVTEDVYKIGIADGEFYIQNQAEPPEPEEEEEVEGE